MAIWPCRPRDFVTHIRRATLEDGSVAIVNSATTHPKVCVLWCTTFKSAAVSRIKMFCFALFHVVVVVAVLILTHRYNAVRVPVPGSY